MTRKEIKARAREALGGRIFGANWLFAVIVMLIFAAINFIFSGGIIRVIIYIIIGGPFIYAVHKLFLKQAYDGFKMDLGDIFSGFREDFTGNIALFIMMNIFLILWSILLVIPGIVKFYSYSMAFFLKADHPDWGWKMCLDESKRLTKGRKMELFVLDLSFIPWLIVGMICLIVGSLWVFAYIFAARAQYYKYFVSYDNGNYDNSGSQQDYNYL